MTVSAKSKSTNPGRKRLRSDQASVTWMHGGDEDMNHQYTRFTITKKIALPFLLLLVLMGAMGIASLLGYDRASVRTQFMEKESFKLIAAGNLRSSLASLIMAANDYIITGKASYRNIFPKYKSNIEEKIQQLSVLSLSTEERAQLSVIQSELRNVDSIAQRIFELQRVQTNPKASALMEQMDYQFGDRIYDEITQLVDYNNTQLKEASAAVLESRRLGFVLILAASVIALTISLIVVVLTMKNISKPILDIVGMAQRITARDFSVRLKTEAKDEIGMLTIAFNVMADEINRRYDELEQFAYIVAHDLKSPITGIRGFSEILKSDFADRLDNDGRDIIDTIIESSDRMTALINDLLAFARAGKVEFAKDPVPLSRMLSDVEADLSFVIKQRNARIDVKSDLPSVLCDPIRFSQVWKNLLSNSIKYNESATPSIEIGHEEIKGPQPMYEFYLKDNGIGIDEKHLETMFMPFKRGTNAAKYEGTGIGLAIVKRVVEFHRGRVWAESKVGEGATFRFTVPKPVQSPVQ